MDTSATSQADVDSGLDQQTQVDTDEFGGQDELGDESGQQDDAGSEQGSQDDGRTLADYLNPQANQRQTDDASFGGRQQANGAPAAPAGPSSAEYGKLVEQVRTAYGDDLADIMQGMVKRIDAMQQSVQQTQQQAATVNKQVQSQQIEKFNGIMDALPGFADRYGTSWAKATTQQREARAKDLRMADAIARGAAANGTRMSPEEAINAAANMSMKKPQAVRQVEQQVRTAAKRNAPVPGGKPASAGPGDIKARAIANIGQFRRQLKE